MTAEGFTAATVYVPNEGAMLVAQKGTGQLLPEYAEMGFTDYIDVSCNRFYCTGENPVPECLRFGHSLAP